MRLSPIIAGLTACALLTALPLLADDTPSASPPATAPSDASMPPATMPATRPAHIHYPVRPTELLVIKEQIELGKYVVSQVNSGVDGDAFRNAVQSKLDDIKQARPPKPDPKAAKPAAGSGSLTTAAGGTTMTGNATSSTTPPGSTGGVSAFVESSTPAAPNGDLNDNDYQALGLYTNGCYARGLPGEVIVHALKAQIKYRLAQRQQEKTAYDAKQAQLQASFTAEPTPTARPKPKPRY